jgi:tryptophan 2,3-dioxygenase
MESSPEPQPAGGTDYAAYLLIDDLLELQRPITEGAHDELLFIIVHQAYELWFKLMLHELVKVDADLRADRPGGALAGLKRVVAIDRLLLAKLDVLETMGPEGFLEFRSPLAPASGFQSRQFREIERATADLWPAPGWRRTTSTHSPASTSTTRSRCARSATRSASCSSTTTRRSSAGASITR